MSRILGRRLAHSLTSGKSTLYGWGNTHALPLTACTENEVFTKPVQLDNRSGYPLQVSRDLCFLKRKRETTMKYLV